MSVVIFKRLHEGVDLFTIIKELSATKMRSQNALALLLAYFVSI